MPPASRGRGLCRCGEVCREEAAELALRARLAELDPKLLVLVGVDAHAERRGGPALEVEAHRELPRSANPLGDDEPFGRGIEVGPGQLECAEQP